MLKKLLALSICFNLIASAPALCQINDDFAQKSLSKDLQIEKNQKVNIEDEFVQKTLDKNLKVKTTKPKLVVDDFAQKNTQKNAYSKPKVDFCEQIVVVDKNISAPKKPLVVIGENSVPVKIRIKKNYSTRNKIDEGDYIYFETVSDVKINNKTYPAGTSVKARVETVSQNKIWGVPSDLTIGNFTLEGNKLGGEINKTGANRSLWLYPTVYLTACFFGVGLLLIPIRGGHAKVNTRQIYTMEYR